MASSSWPLAFLAIGVACVWFGTLDMRHLQRFDEGRYAELAREMFVTGDWVTIRYNGLKYFEKPPFHLWMTALAYHAFGVGDWQARLWGALSGAAGTLLIALAAWRHHGPRVALFAALVLVATPIWNVGAHVNTLDTSLAGALAAVLAGVLLAQHRASGPATRRRWMLFAWGAMGVALLTKGLIGVVLPVMALVVYTVWRRDFQIWRRLHIVSGSLVLLAVTVPWFWLVTQRNPEFLHFFFVQEHFQRYTSTAHNRVGPWWYYVPLLALGFLPWLGLLPGMASQVRQAPRSASLQVGPLLAAWALSILVFFSLSASKLPGYIQPMMPALAMLAALALDRLRARTWTRLLIAASIVGVALALASPLVERLASETAPQEQYRAYRSWLTAAALLLTAGTLAALALQLRGLTTASIVAYSLAMFGCTTLAIVGHETLGRSNSGIDLVPAIQARLTRDMPFYGVRLLDHTLPFYLGHTLIMVESPDELAFGTKQEPDKWLPTIEAFKERWRNGPNAIAVMRPDTFAELNAQGLPMFGVVQDPRRVVVANFPPQP